MSDSHKNNQRNKQIVWDYWQRMNHASPEEVPGLIRKTFHSDVNWNGPHPINQIMGIDALISDFWQPLLSSFPDLKRTADILMGGMHLDQTFWPADPGDGWVSGTGYLTGTFAKDWLGIPATGRKTNIHFGQFFMIRGKKIAASYVVLDILSVMQQAGFQVLPPALGAEGGKVQKPQGGDGVILTEQSELESRKTMQMFRAMVSGMRRYVRSRDGGNLQSMDQQNYWDPDFHWYGPTGVGASHDLTEYQDFHQRPWLTGFGDRGNKGLGKSTGQRLGYIAEGQYLSLGGWDGKYSRQNGEYQGVTASGNIITIRDFDWYKRVGDDLIQNWVTIDMIDLFNQMGIDLFDRMHRQNDLRKRGINWWNLPVEG